MNWLKHYVCDNNAIINLQSISWITKKNKVYSSLTWYILEVQYKNRALELEYSTEGARDAMFDKATKALVKIQETTKKEFEASLGAP